VEVLLSAESKWILAEFLEVALFSVSIGELVRTGMIGEVIGSLTCASPNGNNVEGKDGGRRRIS
jgi:hypothetical protein